MEKSNKFGVWFLFEYEESAKLIPAASTITLPSGTKDLRKPLLWHKSLFIEYHPPSGSKFLRDYGNREVIRKIDEVVVDDIAFWVVSDGSKNDFICGFTYWLDGKVVQAALDLWITDKGFLSYGATGLAYWYSARKILAGLELVFCLQVSGKDTDRPAPTVTFSDDLADALVKYKINESSTLNNNNYVEPPFDEIINDDSRLLTDEEYDVYLGEGR